MPEIESIQAQRGEMAEWRRDFHRHPELLYDVHRTAGIVAAKLRAFGCDEVAEGIGQTGVVGIIQGKAEGPTVGLRADMDALPIRERNDFAHKSTIEGKMHACGHDGHTAMLLGAARYLAQTRDFAGRVAAIFQPAEEGGAGGLAMVKDGMMTRFAIERVFGMHNMPKMSAKSFGARAGACMAAADFFDIEIEGRGGHAAYPHDCVDPVAVGAQIVGAAQHLVSREVEAVDRVVISICEFHAGDAYNVIPQTAILRGTARFLREETRSRIESRLAQLCEQTALAHRAVARLHYKRLYPATVNDPEAARFAAQIAARVAGEENVEFGTPPSMGGEDFSFMLNERPGAFVFIGNGDTAGLHSPDYDFNDGILAMGASYWARLAEASLPISK